MAEEKIQETYQVAIDADELSEKVNEVLTFLYHKNYHPVLACMLLDHASNHLKVTYDIKMQKQFFIPKVEKPERSEMS